MIHRGVLLAILCSLTIVSGRIVEFSLSQSRAGSCSYEIGEPVIMTCRVEGDSELSVMFRHGTYKAENGISHFDKYVASKVPAVGNKHVRHVLTILKLEWDDHGQWECVQGGTAWNATIDITVLGSLQPLRASLAPGGLPGSDQQQQQRAARTDKSDASSGEDGGETVPRILYGKGIKTNPFDLTGGARVLLECVTGCSYPPSKHRWAFSNHSLATPETALEASTTSRNCSVPNKVSGLSTRSAVLLSCQAMPALVGSNEVSCTIVDETTCRKPDYSHTAPSDAGADTTDGQGQRRRHRRRSVFVLCPGGHKQWTLTNGEIVGMSIAIGLTAFMLVMFFMSAKKIVSSYRYGTVVKGIRV